jgi:urease accessory protein
MKISKILLPSIAVIIALMPTNALAHNGEHTSGLLYGIQHPISGLDHILVMIAAGLIAYLIGGKAKLLLPLMFIVSMIIGSLLGISGVNLSFIQPVILLSSFVLGSILLFLLKLPNIVNYSMIVIFAFFHGLSHGVEAPKSLNSLNYIVGFVLTTLSLHIIGLIIGYIAQNFNVKIQSIMYRLAGVLILLVSTWILIKN